MMQLERSLDQAQSEPNIHTRSVFRPPNQAGDMALNTEAVHCRWNTVFTSLVSVCQGENWYQLQTYPRHSIWESDIGFQSNIQGHRKSQILLRFDYFLYPHFIFQINPSPVLNATSMSESMPRSFAALDKLLSIVPLIALTHWIPAFLDDTWPVEDRCPNIRTTGQTFSCAWLCAVVLPEFVGSLP